MLGMTQGGEGEGVLVPLHLSGIDSSLDLCNNFFEKLGKVTIFFYKIHYRIDRGLRTTGV